MPYNAIIYLFQFSNFPYYRFIMGTYTEANEIIIKGKIIFLRIAACITIIFFIYFSSTWVNDRNLKRMIQLFVLKEIYFVQFQSITDSMF